VVAIGHGWEIEGHRSESSRGRKINAKGKGRVSGKSRDGKGRLEREIELRARNRACK